ncbi:MAG: NAD(P)-binding protein [Saprospiraceae bacterium]|nr:NAD(P)-binding protein [Saprospiraceae bacterium]
MNNKKKVAIIRSGIGGMAIAIRLAQKGHDVDLYEKIVTLVGSYHISN